MDEIRIILKDLENQNVKMQATASRLGRVVTYEKGKTKNTTCVFRSILLVNISLLSFTKEIQVDHLWLNPNDFKNKQMYFELMQLVAQKECNITLEGRIRKYHKYPSYDDYLHVTYYTTDYSISDIISYSILSTKERKKKNKKKKSLNFKGYFVSKNGNTYFHHKLLYSYKKGTKKKKRDLKR